MIAFVEQNPRLRPDAIPGRRAPPSSGARSTSTTSWPTPSTRTAINQVDIVRTVLAFPDPRATELLGVIMIFKREVRPFLDGQIALMETFADQAAIAIENARLLTELQAKNADLTEALEQQTATSEILRVISNSPTDVQPVFMTIVRSAVQLSGARTRRAVSLRRRASPSGRAP